MGYIFNTPITIHNLQLKNRIVFAPTTMGLPLEAYLGKIKEIAAGGTGLIIIGDVPVLKSSFHSLYSKKGFEYYKKVTEVIHKNGAKASAQLHVSDSNIKAMVKYIPGVLTKKISKDKLRVLLNQEVGNYISGLKLKQVKKITHSYGEAARLAKKAGFDMIQIHGDRMCGSFSSSIFNHRTDCYGGSVKNRARFAAEAVHSVRRALLDIPIEYKLAVRQEEPHYGNAGVLIQELKYFVPYLEKAGVDSFHITLANHSNLNDTIPPKNHEYFKEQGCFLKYCDEVKKYTSLPICGVGALTDPAFIEEQIRNKRIDYAAMSRQLIADPKWVKKAESGMKETIHTCIRCNKKCLGGMQAHEGVHCIYEL